MVMDAAAYMYRVPQLCQTPRVPTLSLPSRTTSDLRADVGVMRANPRSILILTARPLPEPGAINPHLETLARLGELSRVQLTNGRTIPIREIIQLLKSVGNDAGWLMVAKQLLSSDSDKTIVASVAQYQPYQQKMSPFKTTARCSWRSIQKPPTFPENLIDLFLTNRVRMIIVVL